MSTPMPGYVFQCQAPPTPSPASSKTKSPKPASSSLIAAPIPENPAPTIATSWSGAAGMPRAPRLPALLDRHVLAVALALVDLARAGDLRVRVVEHLHPLRDPARRARDREDHREHVGRDLQRLVDQARVVVDVRVELAVGEVLVVERLLLELGGDLELRVLPGDLEHLVDMLLDDPRARVVVLVDAVAEAHQALVAVLHALEEVRDVVLGLDAVEHPQHGLVGAAVQRAVEGGRAGGHGRVRVD